MSSSNPKSNSAALPLVSLLFQLGSCPWLRTGIIFYLCAHGSSCMKELWMILGCSSLLKKLYFSSHAAVSAGVFLAGLQRAVGTHVVPAHPSHWSPPSSFTPDFPLPDALAVLGPMLSRVLMIVCDDFINRNSKRPSQFANVIFWLGMWAGKTQTLWLQATKPGWIWEEESRERRRNF